MGFIYFFIGAAMIVFSIFQTPQISEEEMASRAKNTAINFILYRDSVHKYVYAQNPYPAGNIADTIITLPMGFIKNGWIARVEGNICYIYGVADMNVKNFVRELMLGSHSIGEKRNGLFYPQYRNPLALPAFIPENALVSVMELR